MTLSEEIRALAREHDAIILAHNYCRPEVQDVADFTGDSLELARRATTVSAGTIVFCGVHFMAETAVLLNPGKTVLIPDPSAGCAMAEMADATRLREMKALHPGAAVVCYVNSTAAVKAECDMCVTSGNAEKVLASFPAEREIIFVPDQHLGGYIAKRLGRTYTLWPGYCPIHAALTPEKIAAARAAHPGCPVLVHPECDTAVRDAADERLSTGGMCTYARNSAAHEIIVGTEIGILHRLRRENPNKVFHPVDAALVCPDMKKITLENLAASLRLNQYRVAVDPAIAERAARPIRAMLAL